LASVYGDGLTVDDEGPMLDIGYGDGRGTTGGSVGSSMKDKKEGRSLLEKGIFQIPEFRS